MKQEIGDDHSTNKNEDENKIEDNLTNPRQPKRRKRTLKTKTTSENEDNLKKWVGYEWLIIILLI